MITLNAWYPNRYRTGDYHGKLLIGDIKDIRNIFIVEKHIASDSKTRYENHYRIEFKNGDSYNIDKESYEKLLSADPEKAIAVEK